MWNSLSCRLSKKGEASIRIEWVRVAMSSFFGPPLSQSVCLPHFSPHPETPFRWTDINLFLSLSDEQPGSLAYDKHRVQTGRGDILLLLQLVGTRYSLFLSNVLALQWNNQCMYKDSTIHGFIWEAWKLSSHLKDEWSKKFMALCG